MGTHLLQPSPGLGSEWGLCRGGRTAVEGMKTGEGEPSPAPQASLEVKVPEGRTASAQEICPAGPGGSSSTRCPAP